MSAYYQDSNFRINPARLYETAISALATFGGVVLVALSWVLCKRWEPSSGHGRRSCFGLRYSIIFFTLGELLNALSTGVPNTFSPFAAILYYQFEGIGIPSAIFIIAADIVLAYCVAKVLLYGRRHETRGSLGITAPLAAIGIATIVADIVYFANDLAAATDFYYSQSPIPDNGLDLIFLEATEVEVDIAHYAILALLGSVFLLLAVRNMRRASGGSVASPRLMLLVALLWLCRGVVVAVCTGLAYIPLFAIYKETYYLNTPHLNYEGIEYTYLVIRPFFQLATYAVLVHVFRGPPPSPALFEKDHVISSDEALAGREDVRGP